jgi:hypothetical protein
MDSPDPAIHAELKRIINSKDGKKNTPLHYATQLWSQDTVRKHPDVCEGPQHCITNKMISGPHAFKTRIEYWHQKPMGRGANFKNYARNNGDLSGRLLLKVSCKN